MSFLLDPPLLITIGLIVGKANYLSMAFSDSFFKRGSNRKNLFIIGLFITVIFWIYSSVLYLDMTYFPWPLPKWFNGSDWMLNSGLPLGLTKTPATDITAIVIFATYPFWYYLGTEFGVGTGIRINGKQRLRERNEIIIELVRTVFPKGGAIPVGADDVDAAKSVIEFIDRLPPIFSESAALLLYVFDSRLFVLPLTGKWTRFVNLDKDRTSTSEKRKYFESWESNLFLLNGVQILKLISSFGYYTKKDVWKYIDYKGPLLPDDPPWYNPGPVMKEGG